MTSSITNEIMQLYTDREVLNMGLCSRYKSLTCNSCSMHCQIMPEESPRLGNDSNLLIVFYVQIMPDDFVMQLHRF
ncbi:hypothetical protein GTQ78_04290 [Escherichia coli]|nr:hypothetical protein GTQ78_04290 [Escherichia coli]